MWAPASGDPHPPTFSFTPRCSSSDPARILSCLYFDVHMFSIFWPSLCCNIVGSPRLSWLTLSRDLYSWVHVVVDYTLSGYRIFALDWLCTVTSFLIGCVFLVLCFLGILRLSSPVTWNTCHVERSVLSILRAPNRSDYLVLLCCALVLFLRNLPTLLLVVNQMVFLG